MSEGPEKRFERALDRLFSSPASSTAGAASSSKERKKGIPSRDDNLVGPRATSTPKTGGRPPRVAGSSSHAAVPFNSQSVCRPWDRGDLFRRLATFKSMTWFGKPEEAGPVNCSRKGWVNVDVDLIACEGCHAKLSFPSPTTWSQQQVERAAESFSKKLDSAHKELCPWKGNVCSQTLAQFPPMTVETLMEGFRDRCDALLQLSTLPVISNPAIDHLKLSRSQQIDRLLAQPVPGVGLSIEMPKDGAETGSCTYFQAQRIISLCGWEPRVLPYIVDYEDDSTLSAVRSSGIAAHDKVKVRRHSDPGPTVLLCPRTERLKEKGDKDKVLYTEQRSNTGSAVLDCSLCGASVGLWLFSQVHRPSILALTPADVMKTGSAPSACGFSAASGIERGCSDDHERKENAEKHDEGGEAVTSDLAKPVPRAVALDLKLTIAGGPPPTQFNSNGLNPSLFSPNPFAQPGISSSSRDEVGDRLISNVLGGSEGQGHAINVRIASDKQMNTMFCADTEGHANLKNNVADKPKICGAELQKRELAGELSPVLAGSGIEKETDGRRTWKRKRNEHSVIEDLPRYSSVDAMDTCFHSRHENSTESVEMPQEADSQGTANSRENNDRVAHSLQSIYGQAIEKHEKSPVSSKDEGVARNDCNNNISTVVKSSVTKNLSKALDVGHQKYNEKIGQETVGYHDEQGISRSVAEATRIYKEASEMISEEERQDPEVIGGGDQGGILSGHPENRVGSVNNVLVMEGNSGDSGGRQEESEKQLVLLSDERMCGGEPMKPFKADAVPESSTGAMTRAERILDSGMLWEKEPTEFDPLLQHRHFCPWVNVNFMKLRSSSDNQCEGMCGWQLTLDALEASPVIIESESASSIYNADPLSAVRKILGSAQRSQKKSRNH